MKILDNIKSWVGNKIRAYTFQDKEGPFYDWATGGRKTSSGENVSNNSALQLSTVFDCIRSISEDVAKLPFKVYRDLVPTGKEIRKEHPVYRLIHNEPNSEMTAMGFRETLTAHCLGWGNGYAEIVRDTRGVPLSLWPLPPDRVKPYRKDNGSIWYEVTVDGGTVNIQAANMLHIRGPGFDGLVGYNVIRYARESIGGALASQKFASAFYKNNATPGGILTHQNNLSGPAQDRLKESMEKQTRGAENASRLIVLEEGMTFTRMTIPPEEAQFLETRQFSVADICRWFRMLPGKVGDTTRAQGWSTLEMTNTDYVTDTLMPWLVRWEQEIERKLFRPSELSDGYFVRHVVNGLLRGDMKTRFQSYSLAYATNWLNPDEIREFEDMNPISDGEGEKYKAQTEQKTAGSTGGGNGYESRVIYGDTKDLHRKIIVARR